MTNKQVKEAISNHSVEDGHRHDHAQPHELDHPHHDHSDSHGVDHAHPHHDHKHEDEHNHPHKQGRSHKDNHAHPHGEDPHNSHSHKDNHAHPHENGHGHDEHEHEHGGKGWLGKIFPFFHGHSHGDANIDAAMETNERGIWALKVSLLMLTVTATFQVAIVLISGSVALLADTIHNFSDALTAIPLWIAFALSRRAANRRYTYGYGRIEDVAGVIIVLMIFFSALITAYESYQKIINPQPITNLGWVIAAALVGFVGNEAVALFRIRIGREIGSAALIADGQHARVDGITSLAVLFGVVGVLVGFPLADPIVGLLITVAILFIVKDTALTMWRRLLDAVEPELVDKVEQVAAAVPGVLAIGNTRIRWLGHKLQAELQIEVDGQLTTSASHHLAEEVRHALLHAQPRLAIVNIHVDPFEQNGENYHALNTHHDLAL
ncbi:MAG: cation diffusion facilitator family transporter [Chloroflexi bacterium]|nr:cation diffusion facilitator family transporter [Chloroflexota bacterium]